jgi:hypothetical protein
LIQFLRNRPVVALLGGHIEMDAQGKLFEWQSPYHPLEHTLRLTSADLQALSVALAHFNGFYTESGGFTMENSIRLLVVIASGAVVILVGAIWLAVHYIRRYIRRRKSAMTAGA